MSRNLFKKGIFLVLFFLFFFISVNAYKYNSSWENLVLEEDSWCANLALTDKVYTESNESNKELIKDNLCKGNETPEEDNCLEFTVVPATIKIYDGPLEGLPLLYEGELNSNGEFEYTFLRPEQYLIEIYPKSGEYNDYHERLNIEECKITMVGGNNPEIIEKKEELFNSILNYPEEKISIELINNKYKKEKKDYNILNIINSNNLEKLNNTLIEISITSQNITENNFKIKFDFSKFNISEPQNLKLYKFDLSNNQWVEEKNVNIENKNLILSSGELETYALVNSQVKKELIPKDTNKSNKVNNTTKNNKNTHNKNTPVSNSNSPLNIGVVIGIVIALASLGVVGFFLLSNKPKSLPTKKIEVLSDRDKIYKKTKEYVKKYKHDYSRDKIYRMLKKTKVPKDIIDKVYLEEYN